MAYGEEKEDYGPKGTMYVTPDGTVYRYQSTHSQVSRTPGREDQWYYTYEFEYWPAKDDTILNKAQRTSTFRLPPGSLRFFEPGKGLLP